MPEIEGTEAAKPEPTKAKRTIVETVEDEVGEVKLAIERIATDLSTDIDRVAQRAIALAVARITSVETKLLAEIRTWAFLFALGNALAWLVLR